jgi:putative NIF3 family GTP cyclohydrolase 1 type 2
MSQKIPKLRRNSSHFNADLMNPLQPGDVSRRAFMSTVTKVAGSAIVLSQTAQAQANGGGDNGWTVGQVMDLFIKEVPGSPLAQTVDTLKAGNRDMKVTGIVTTMFATVDVIRKAIALNANFIIAHEPTFYNHLDDTAWLAADPVYQFKAELLAKNSIAVWRNHDYIHRLTTDGVRAGVVKQLGWEKYQGSNPSVFQLPSTTLRALIGDVKRKLGIPTVRYVGDLADSCAKVLLMPGAAGGRNQIGAIAREKPDVVLCGEVAEWETAEYTRDARSKGEKISLVVLGHVASEEPGSRFLADWLTEKVAGIKTTHVPAGNSLMFA